MKVKQIKTLKEALQLLKSGKKLYAESAAEEIIKLTNLSKVADIDFANFLEDATVESVTELEKAIYAAIEKDRKAWLAKKDKSEPWSSVEHRDRMFKMQFEDIADDMQTNFDKAKSKAKSADVVKSVQDLITKISNYAYADK